MFKWGIFILAFLFSRGLAALEIQAFLTKDCSSRSGMIIHVEDGLIEYIDLQGHLKSLPKAEVQTLYTFDTLVNPFAAVTIDERTLRRLKAVYTDSATTPSSYAFAVRFVEDLLILYGLDGKTRVYTYADLNKIRPAPADQLGTHVPPESRPVKLNLTAQSDRCQADTHADGLKATRILSDPIAIDEFLSSFEKGYSDLASFEERTYLYPRPFIYPKRARLGLVFEGQHEEPSLSLPVYFQWSSGEPYRFQSFNVVGLKSHEFTPNTEPVFAIRSDVKSHIFHAMFIGNVVGLPAGNSVFLKPDILKMTDPFSIEPSFNYMALMGADVGAYSLSAGLFYPTFGVRVQNEYREILGSSVSYIVRAMYTTAKLRLRVIGSIIDHDAAQAGQTDVLSRTGDSGTLGNPDSFKFQAYFLRGGLDFDWNERLTTGADATLINGTYHEVMTGTANSLKFNKMTIQAYVQRHFGHYVSLSAFMNFIEKDYDSNMFGTPLNKSQQESVFFGSMEFLF